MLKLTKKADYGLIALKHLAVNGPESSSAKEIADTYGIPVALLSKILQKLAKNGFLRSEHGTNGGYKLARDAARNHGARSDPHHRRPDFPDGLFHRARLLLPHRQVHRARPAAEGSRRNPAAFGEHHYLQICRWILRRRSRDAGESAGAAVWLGASRRRRCDEEREMKLPIYMDNHATTPVDPRVFERCCRTSPSIFGNAASRNHSFGWEAEEAVEKARKQIADLIGATAKEIVFTSGATESNNLAHQGRGRDVRREGQPHHHRRHRAQGGARHLQAAREARLSRHLSAGADRRPGRSRTCCRTAITDKTILISIMYANNEIGVIQPIAEIGKIAKRRACCSTPTRRRRSARSRST